MSQKYKKDGKYLNVYIKSEIFDRFDSYAKEKGQPKTTALERVLTAYLDEYDKKKERDLNGK